MMVWSQCRRIWQRTLMEELSSAALAVTLNSLGAYMELLDVINTNGTCRFYKDDPVDGEVIVRLLQAAQ